MKKMTLAIAITGCIAGIVLTGGCSSPNQKVEEAKENLKEAEHELSQQQKDSVADIEQFKKEIESKIADNEKRVAELNGQIAKEKKMAKEKYQKKIDELEQKNKDMKSKLYAYDYKEGKEKWESFKREFKHDMDELGKALKDFTVKKNTK